MKHILFVFLFLFQFLLCYSIEMNNDTIIVNKLIFTGERNINKNADSSIIALKNAMQLSTELRYEKGYIDAGFLLAKVYKQKGLYLDAIKTIEYLQGYSEELNNNELRGKCFYTLGEINRAAFNLRNALINLNKALVIFKKLQNLQEQANCFNRIAAILFESKNMKLSELYADSSSHIAISLKNYKLVSSNEEIIGAIYRRTNKYNEAIQKLESALQYSILSGDSVDLPNIYNNFGYTYLEMRDYNKAIQYAKKAYEMSEKKEILIYSIGAAEILATSYMAKDQIVLAFNYLHYRDSLFSKMIMNDRNTLIMDLNEKIEATQKDQHRILLQKENDLKSVTIKNQKYQFAFALLLLLIVSIGAVFVYLERRKISRINNLLKLQKNELENQHIKLSEAYIKLKELQTFKDDLTNMIVHDLKNPLNTIINISVMKDVPEKDMLIHEAGREMNSLVMNILDVYKYQNKTMILNKQNVNVKSLVDDAIKDVSFLGKSRSIVFQVESIESLEINIDKSIMQRVIVNILTNAIKFSPLLSRIEIKTEIKFDQYISISIKDNGPGIRPEKQDSIFDRFQSDAQKDALIYSTGLGLNFCKIAMEAHNGSIHVESIDMKGSRFSIVLPLTENAIILNSKSKIDYNFENVGIEFNANAMDVVMPIIDQLKKYEVYQVSDIFNVLEKLLSNNDPIIEKWKAKVKNAVLVCNQDQYSNLVNLK